MNTTRHGTVSWQLLAAFGVATSLALAGCAATPAPTPSAPSASLADPAAVAALPAKYKDAGVINVASDIPFPPMEMFDANQQVTGFDYDLGQALGDKLGVKLNFQVQAFDSIIPSLQSGKHDVIMSGMNDTAEREKVLDFVDYLHAGFSIIVASGNPEKITTVLDLCGKNVAVQKATVQGEILRGYDSKCIAAGSGAIKLMELPLETDAQTAVRAGKAIADVVDSSVAAYAALTAGDGKYFSLVHDPANPSGYEPLYTGIGVLKSDSGLSNALLLAFKSLVADGGYKKILAKYNMTDYAVDSAGINLGS